MDKYEYKVKLAQLEKLVEKKDYVTAAKIADGIDWRKVKSVNTLNMVADIYEANNRFEDCYEILNIVYDRSPNGRRAVYRMTQVATKMHDFEEAIDLYKEYVKIAPRDLNRYILKYHIYKERGSSVADQITILEEYKSYEYDEKWSYELACLYEEAGMIDQCVEECDELILWFSEGEYVVKAMELKMKYQELTAAQQEKFEHRYDYLEAEVQEVQEEEKVSEVEIPAETSEEAETAEVTEAADETEVPGIVIEAEEKEKEAVLEENVEEKKEETAEEEDDTPTVSVINTNKFSTINLQEELAKGLQMILAESEGELEDILDAEPTLEIKKEVVSIVAEAAEEVPPEAEILVEEEVTEPKEIPLPEEEKVPETALSETGELKSELLKYITVPQELKMEEMLRTEDDGQITLAIGEEDILEKQITGQMTIEEILEAWEEKKRQAKEEMEKAGVKKEAVLFETGEITNLLQDFIPRTPKDVQEMMDAIENGTEPEPEERIEESVEETEGSEEPEIEVIEEEVFLEELEDEVKEEYEEVEELPEAELEDDLPLDLDLAEVLESALEEKKEEKEPVLEEPIFKESVAETPHQVLGQNTASMLDAIERALAMEMTPLETAGQYLTEEQEKIFAYFTSVNGMKKQLLELLHGDSVYADREDSTEGNLIITGHPGNGKTTLAIDIVKAFQKQRKTKGGKLAKVSGDGLNKKNPQEVVSKLGGGALIIERAGSLSAESAEKLSVAMEGSTGGLLVILEDDAKEIARLLEKNQNFARKFNRCIDIPIFSNDELVAFGKSYAEEQEYYFDEMAVLALYDCIGVRQTSNHVVNVAEVKGFIDDAIEHANKKSKGFFARFSKKRVDEEGNKLLLEEDFDY